MAPAANRDRFAARYSRRLKKRRAMKGYAMCEDKQWQCKVEELAGRGFSLRALLKFYRGLGNDYMLHFDPCRSTTEDVVRNAIIPLSSKERCALACVMMGGVVTRPRRMVTHTWGNLFADLVAAIVSDAFGDDQYSWAQLILAGELDALEEQLSWAGVFDNTYWVCAFSINQHAGICGGNPTQRRDCVTKEVYPICTCARKKYFNSDAPLRSDGRSIACEMNKFDDMMNFLVATDPDFAQIIAVDKRFKLFTRAWCVAELAAAFQSGMKQSLKVLSAKSLFEQEEFLRSIKIEDMDASRAEDVAEILAKIPDKRAYNIFIQNLIFNELIVYWSTFTVNRQMQQVGRIVRTLSLLKRMDST